MTGEKFDSARIVSYWITESSEALDVATHLVEKEDFSYALFFGHLAVEKLLKAIFVSRHKTHPPPIHNLVRLANLCEVRLDEKRRSQLVIITSFNLEARYPDVTREFRKRCTRQFATEKMDEVMEVMKWLQTMI